MSASFPVRAGIRRWPSRLLVLMVLASPAASAQEAMPGLAGKPMPAPPQESQILVAVPQLAGVEPLRYVMQGAYVGRPAQAETLMFNAPPSYAQFRLYDGPAGSGTLLIDTPSAGALVKTFPVFEDRNLRLADRGRAESPLGNVDYQRFTANPRLSCFSFVHPLWKPNLGKAVVLDGYFCDAEAELDHARIAAILSKVGVEGFGEP